jgi:hypothetical protein
MFVSSRGKKENKHAFDDLRSEVTNVLKKKSLTVEQVGRTHIAK